MYVLICLLEHLLGNITPMFLVRMIRKAVYQLARSNGQYILMTMFCIRLAGSLSCGTNVWMACVCVCQCKLRPDRFCVGFLYLEDVNQTIYCFGHCIDTR